MTVSSVSHRMEDIFTYPFSDPKSPGKILIAVLLMLANLLIPLLPMFILNGYMLEIRRRLILNGKLEMPEWADWGRYFSDGAKAFAIEVLFILPVIFLAVAGFAVVFIPGLLLDTHVINQGGNTPLVVLVSGILSLAGLVLCGLMILLGIAAGFVLPAAVTNFAVKGRFSAAFNISEWWAIVRNNFSDFLIAYIILIVIGILTALIVQLLSLTIVLCLLIPFLIGAVFVYGLFISSGLFARAYLGGVEKFSESKPGSVMEVS